MLHTTFKRARENRACSSGYNVILDALGEEYGDDKVIPLKRVVSEIGLRATLPILPGSIIEQDEAQSFLRTFACDCVERFLPTFEAASSGDDRPAKAIAGIRSYLKDEISEEALISLSQNSWGSGKNPELDSATRSIARAASEAAWPRRISMAINHILSSLPQPERAEEIEWQTNRFLGLLNEV